MIRYLITDGSAASDSPGWLENVAYWIEDGVDFVQIREPELTTRSLRSLVAQVLSIRSTVRVLVNDRSDVAIAAGAHGVHLRDGSIRPDRLRQISTRRLIVSVACHDPETTAAASESGADLIVLAPVFTPLSKAGTSPPLGLAGLREAAARARTPIIALGGITTQNAADCLQAGAAGVAGISLFSRIRQPSRGSS